MSTSKAEPNTPEYFKGIFEEMCPLFALPPNSKKYRDNMENLCQKMKPQFGIDMELFTKLFSALRALNFNYTYDGHPEDLAMFVRASERFLNNKEDIEKFHRALFKFLSSFENGNHILKLALNRLIEGSNSEALVDNPQEIERTNLRSASHLLESNEPWSCLTDNFSTYKLKPNDVVNLLIQDFVNALSQCKTCEQMDKLFKDYPKEESYKYLNRTLVRKNESGCPSILVEKVAIAKITLKLVNDFENDLQNATSPQEAKRILVKYKSNPEYKEYVENTKAGILMENLCNKQVEELDKSKQNRHHYRRAEVNGAGVLTALKSFVKKYTNGEENKTLLNPPPDDDEDNDPDGTKKNIP